MEEKPRFPLMSLSLCSCFSSAAAANGPFGGGSGYGLFFLSQMHSMVVEVASEFSVLEHEVEVLFTSRGLSGAQDDDEYVTVTVAKCYL